jgi:hypothetical protein
VFIFRRLKINHESHEFILDPGTVANKKDIVNSFLFQVSAILQSLVCADSEDSGLCAAWFRANYALRYQRMVTSQYSV